MSRPPERAAAPGPGPERLARITRSDRSLFSKSSLTIASRILSKLAQLGWLVVAARLLSVDEFAQYGYVVSLALTFAVLGDAGVGTIAGREIASGAATPRRAFWTAVPVVGVTGVAVSVLFCCFLIVGSGPGVNAPSIAAGAAFILGNRAFDLSATSLRALGRIELEAALLLLNAVLFVGLATAVALAGGGVALVLLVLAANYFLVAGLAAAAIRGDVGGYVHVPLRSTLGLLRAGLFVSFASFGLSICTRTPLVVLGNTAPPSQVAYYTAAVRFADTALTLSVTVGFGLMPGLANIDARDPRRARSLIVRTMGFLAIAAVAVAVPTVAVRHQIATTVFGSDLGGAAGPLGVFMAALAVFAVTGVAWFALLALRRERLVFAAAWGGFATSLVLSLTVGGTPVGAAWSYVGGLAAVAVTLLVALAARRPRARAAPGASERVPEAFAIGD